MKLNMISNDAGAHLFADSFVCAGMYYSHESDCKF